MASRDGFPAARPGASDPAARPLRSGAGFALPAALLAAALALPFLVGSFLLFQLTMAMVYAIAILGLNLLTGVGGQFSLGHGAFFALGAYTAALMVEIGGSPHLLTLPAAAAICFAAGFLFGRPALRLEGLSLALATYGLALAMPQLLRLSPLEPWTGGVQGLVLLKPDAPLGLPLSQDRWLYLLTLGIGVLMYGAARNLVGSRTGRALMAIRDDPSAASAAGVDVALYKSLAFGISALYAGVAGALGALVVGFVAPDSYTATLSVGLFVGLVVGGAGWLPGALVGGAFVLFVPNLAESVSRGLSGAVYGLILILSVHLARLGVAGRLAAVFGAGRGVRCRSEHGTEQPR